MNKILIVFDVLALLALAYLIIYFSSITSDVVNREVFIEYFTGISYIGLILMMPVLHGVVLYERRHDLTSLQKKWFNISITCLFLFLLMVFFYVSHKYKQKIISAGYVSCESDGMTMGNYIIYGKDEALCEKLILLKQEENPRLG